MVSAGVRSEGDGYFELQNCRIAERSPCFPRTMRRNQGLVKSREQILHVQGSLPRCPFREPYLDDQGKHGERKYREVLDAEPFPPATVPLEILGVIEVVNDCVAPLLFDELRTASVQWGSIPFRVGPAVREGVLPNRSVSGYYLPRVLGLCRDDYFLARVM